MYLSFQAPGDSGHDLLVCAEYNQSDRVCTESFYGKAKHASMCVLTLRDESCEEFANESVLWLIPWWALMTSGLSSVEQMIRSFHHELSKEDDMAAFLEISKESVVDFAELYDLDIQTNRAKDYGAQYTNLKKLAGVDQDYGRLKGEIQALGHQLEVRNSNRNAQKLAWLTGVIIALAFLATIMRSTGK